MFAKKAVTMGLCAFLILGLAQWSPAQTTSPDKNLSDREDVRMTQLALRALEYNPGEANGMLTAKTRQAIREFQWLNSLPVTGNLDARTKKSIEMQAKGGTRTTQLHTTKGSSAEHGRPQAMARVVAQDRTAPNRADRTVSTKVDDEGAERARKAADVLHELTRAADKGIPNELLERAEAIAVIPNMMRGAFGIGGRWGKGVVSQRLDSGRWSPPAFIEVGGGSFGAQIGVTSTDLVLVFTDRDALDLLEEGKDLKLGVDASVAAGPVGRSAEAGVNLNLETAVYSYSRSKGLFAGVALDGAVLDIDDSRNEKVYGPSVTAKDILSGRVSNATGRPFMDALEKTVPKKRMSQK
jgi:lipid-binding SYLF domain-containing protein